MVKRIHSCYYYRYKIWYSTFHSRSRLGEERGREREREREREEREREREREREMETERARQTDRQKRRINVIAEICLSKSERVK